MQGDKFAGEFPRELLGGHGVTYRPCSRSTSENYLAMLPAVNSGSVLLLDHPDLLRQLRGLERRTARGGRDSIDHAPRAHDDVINAAAGALVLAGDRRDCGVTF